MLSTFNPSQKPNTGKMAALTSRVGTVAPGTAQQKRAMPRVAFKPVAQLSGAAGQPSNAAGPAARASVVSKVRA